MQVDKVALLDGFNYGKAFGMTQKLPLIELNKRIINSFDKMIVKPKTSFSFITYGLILTITKT